MNYRSMLLGLVVLFATAVMYAERAEGADSNVEDDPAVEEIVVTGLRRAETVLETPAAITALGAEELNAKGVSEIVDIQYLVPSLQYGEFLGRRQVAIRGIGEFVDAPGVMVSVDGVVQSIASSSQLSHLDLERVEVLRGPQGTLYGRNATGGAVNFISAKPTDELTGHIKGGYAEYDHKSIEGVISGPIGDRVAVRLAANFLDAGEGWIENVQPGEDDLMMGEKSNARLTVVADLTDTLAATFTYGRSTSEGAWDHWSMIYEHYDLGVASGLPATNTRTTPPSEILFTEEPRKVYNLGPSDSDREYDSYSLTLDWDIGDISFKSITALQDWSDEFINPADGTSLGLFNRLRTAETETFTQEVTLTGTHGDFEWVAGGYYMDDERSSRLFFDFPVPALFPLPVPIQLDIQEPFYDTESKAAFVDVTWSVSDRVRLGAGLRRTEEDKEQGHAFTVNGKFPTGIVPIVQVCGPEVFVQKWDESDNTIRASVEYDLSEDSMVYTSYSEGFKVGGVNSSDCNAPWNPETVDSIEIGYKASFGDGATTLRAAAFHYDYSDFQVAQVIGFQGVITNAGDAEIRGLELELTSLLNENWSVNGGFTLLDSEYGSFLNTDTLRANLGLLENKGNPLSYAPDTSINLGVAYETPVKFGGHLTVSVDASYRSRVYYREFDQRKDSTDPYTIVNVNVNWRSDDDLYGARLFVRNVTDEEYVTNIQGSNTTYGRQGTWNMPRQMGVEVTRFFGER
jgi:iron complex outermembrane receptor protein